MTNELPDNGSDHPDLSNELQQFAADLSRLRPRDDRLDQDRSGEGVGADRRAWNRRRTNGIQRRSRSRRAAHARGAA